ncbi:MAG: copper resistance system multicopper oxidase [Pseudomonadota bacterium]
MAGNNNFSSATRVLSRRRFVQGLAAGGVLLSAAAFSGRTLIAQSAPAAGLHTGTAPVLSGTDFELVIDNSPVNYTGSIATATAVNGSIPAPTLRWREGDTVTIRVVNRLQESTSIHWHGIILPFDMDGVPGISFDGIPAGATFTYQFKIVQSGTYWYHSHSGGQEQYGLYGAIIIEPAGGERIQADRDHVVLLSDWTDVDPMALFAKLKVQSDYYNFNQPTVFDFLRDVSRDGLGAALDERRMWQQMRMNPTDLADLSASALTFLCNGTTAASNWTGLFQRGERVRLRFINGCGNTFYDVRIPGQTLTVVQADGQDIEPVEVDEFRFGPGQTYDVLITPTEDACTVFAQTMDRTGYARGTLAVAAGMSAPIPALDERLPLTMADMMGSMAMPATPVQHASTEYGPSTDMRVDTPSIALNDPGIGLRDNGRRVLTLADLHTLGGPLDSRPAEREIELHMTGNMERYTWSFDGVEFGQSTPVHFRHGERLRVILHNDTMMTHPMHLHGMWSELENPDGSFQARLHTIMVQPAQRISFLVTADALGRWAWHCHLMLHMDGGMFREVIIA